MQSVVTIDTDIYTNNKKKPSAKLQEKIKNQSRISVIKDKKSQNQSLRLANDIDIEAFSMAARHLKPGTLGKVIDNLAQIYNEKTGPLSWWS